MDWEVVGLLTQIETSISGLRQDQIEIGAKITKAATELRDNSSDTLDKLRDVEQTLGEILDFLRRESSESKNRLAKVFTEVVSPVDYEVHRLSYPLSEMVSLLRDIKGHLAPPIDRELF